MTTALPVHILILNIIRDSDWSNKIMTISILVAGTVFGVHLYRKKTDNITKKPFFIMLCIIILVIIMVFAIGHLRTQNYYEGAYDFVMFDCFDERGQHPRHCMPK